MDLIVLWFFVYLVKNLFQDLMWLARGEDPPSFRREQERRRLRAERGGPITDRHEARTFWANAWHDAWESAGERRQRRHDQRRTDRQERWDREDDEDELIGELIGATPESDVAPMDVADPLTPVSRRPTDPATPATTSEAKRPETAPTEPIIKGVSRTPFDLGDPIERAAEANYQRYAMRRRNGGSAPTAAQLAADLGIDLADAEDLQSRWDQRYQQEAAARDDMPEEPELREENWGIDEAPVQEQDGAEQTCGECRKALPTPLPRGYDGATYCPRCGADAPASDRDTKEDTASAESAESAHPAGAETPAEGEAAGPTGTPSPPIVKENDMTASGETTGLSSALAYTSSMAASAGEGAASVETSIASLASGEVGGEALTQLAQAQEYLTQAQAAFNAANTALAQHQNVQEAYAATPEAGNKQFMQND